MSRKGKPPQSRPARDHTSERMGVPSSLVHHGPGRAESINQLMRLMLACLETGDTVNLSLPPHHETSEALHRLAYMEGEPARLQVMYNDGTKGKQKGFPARVLWKPAEGWSWNPEGQLDLRIGTLSFRHIDLDHYVDMYLIRDKETRRLSQGATEDLAYDRMRGLLEAPQLRGQACVTIYQAGLEPLAVGVYLALVEHLMERNREGLGALRVKTIYHLDRQPLSIWGSGFE